MPTNQESGQRRRLIKPGKNPCKICGKPIVWTYGADKDRWVPTEPSTAVDDDRVEWIENPRGDDWPDIPLFTSDAGHRHHRRYCNAEEGAEETDKSDRQSDADMFSRRGRGDAASNYAELHLTPSAPIEVVKAAYRALAQSHHPDRGGDELKMKRINVAYQRITEGK